VEFFSCVTSWQLSSTLWHCSWRHAQPLGVVSIQVFSKRNDHPPRACHNVGRTLNDKQCFLSLSFFSWKTSMTSWAADDDTEPSQPSTRPSSPPDHERLSCEGSDHAKLDSKPAPATSASDNSSAEESSNGIWFCTPAVVAFWHFWNMCQCQRARFSAEFLRTTMIKQTILLACRLVGYLHWRFHPRNANPSGTLWDSFRLFFLPQIYSSSTKYRCSTSRLLQDAVTWNLVSSQNRDLLILSMHAARSRDSCADVVPSDDPQRRNDCIIVIDSCEAALRLCLHRFPQHIKAIYRLAHLYTYNERKKVNGVGFDAFVSDEDFASLLWLFLLTWNCNDRLIQWFSKWAELPHQGRFWGAMERTEQSERWGAEQHKRAKTVNHYEGCEVVRSGRFLGGVVVRFSCPTPDVHLDHFLHHTPKLGIPVEMVQFLLKLLLKQISCCAPRFPLALTAKALS